MRDTLYEEVMDMNAGIFGPFNEHRDVLKQISELKNQGYESGEIRIIADTDDGFLREKQQNVQVETLEGKHHFWNKMKSAIFFKSVKDEEIDEVQQMLDVTEEEAKVYYEQLKAGKIFIFIGPESFLDFEDVLYNDNIDSIVRIDTDGL